MKLAGKTDVGRIRRENQDDFRAGELPGGAAWGLVCDGMGGARGGWEASHGACDVIERCFQEQYGRCAAGGEEAFLTQALENANHAVFQKSARDEALAGMGTTVVCALVRDGRAHICHAGDSRAYLYHAGRLHQLTHDHSYVQELVDCGTITPEEAEHHPQSAGDDVLLGMVFRLLGGDGAAVHQFLHIGVVVGQLMQPPRVEQVGPGIPCMADIGPSIPHQGADHRGAHTGQSLLLGGFLEDIVVGVFQRLGQELFLGAGQAAAVLVLEAALDHIAGPMGSFPASPRAAHPVAHQAPGRAAGQFPRTEVVLVFPPDPAHISFPCKFHRHLLSHPAVCAAPGPSPPGAAGRRLR